MLFYKYATVDHRTKIGPGGGIVTEKVKQINTETVRMACIFLAVVLGLAIVSHILGFADGASSLMTAFTAGFGTLFGAILGESQS